MQSRDGFTNLENQKNPLSKVDKTTNLCYIGHVKPVEERIKSLGADGVEQLRNEGGGFVMELLSDFQMKKKDLAELLDVEPSVISNVLHDNRKLPRRAILRLINRIEMGA